MIIKLDGEKLAMLTGTEKNIVKYINANVDKLSYMSIGDIAQETFSSPASISRAVRKCGLSGFNELRYLIAAKKSDHKLADFTDIVDKSQIEVANTLERISIDEINRTVELIKSSRKIYVVASGLSALVGEEFSLRLGILGYFLFNLSDPNIIKKFSPYIQPDELSIVFSLNGSAPEQIEFVEQVASKGGRVVACCCNPESRLVEYSTVFLNGYKHSHISITAFEVTSRRPLYVISRLIIDYLAASAAKV